MRRCLFFPVAAAPREGTGLALESDPIIWGQQTQGGAPPGAMGSRQTTGDRDGPPAGQSRAPRIKPLATSAPEAIASTSTNSSKGEKGMVGCKR